MTTAPRIQPETASHVLSHFGRGGYPAGRFTTLLIQTIDAADQTNEARLAAAYPELFAAITTAKYDEDGIDRLQAIATGRQ